MPPANKPATTALPDPLARSGHYLRKQEALVILGVKPQTLYSYVSRGLIRRVHDQETRTGLYLREDIEKLKAKSVARSGHGPAAAAAMVWGEPVIGSSITELTNQGPRYRGRLATDLAREGSSFETVAEFLWSGVLAEEAVRWRKADLPRHFPLLLQQGAALHKQAHLLQLLTLATVALGIAEGSRGERLLSGSTPVQAARRLIRMVAGVFGFLARGREFMALKDGESIAAGVLRALGIRAAPEQVSAMNTALILVADHELNPATFAARIAASGGVDLHSCIGAALNVHFGSLIGRGCDGAEQLFRFPATPAAVLATARARVRAGQKLPGFNHPLYPHGDPRTRVLVEIAREVGKSRQVTRNMLEALDRLATELEAFPNIETGLVVICRAVGAPDQTAGGIFALGRTAGWAAHVLEQRLQGFMIRPRARFAGALPTR